MIELILCFIVGFVAHKSSYLFDEWERENGRAWPLLGRYQLGVIVLAIGLSVVTRSKERVFEFLAVSVGVGTGVGVGYVVDYLHS